MALTQKRLAKVSNFAEEKTNLSPSVCTCMAIEYGSKLVHFLRSRVPIYVIFNTSHWNSYLKDSHEYFYESQREKGFPNKYQLFNRSDLYNVIVCKREENAHV